MKKRILMSLVATFIIAVSAFAQTNTYNMVLTLTDGTVITIGPNTLMSSITAMQAQIDALKADLAATEKKVSSVENGTTENRYHIKAVEAQIDDNAAATAALKDNLAATVAEVKDVEKRIEDNMTFIAKLENEINMNQKSIDETKAQIANNADAINTVAERMQANKEELQQAIAMVKDEVENDIANTTKNMYTMKEDSDNKIAELTELVSILEQRIKQLEEAE